MLWWKELLVRRYNRCILRRGSCMYHVSRQRQDTMECQWIAICWNPATRFFGSVHCIRFSSYKFGYRDITPTRVMHVSMILNADSSKCHGRDSFVISISTQSASSAWKSITRRIADGTWNNKSPSRENRFSCSLLDPHLMVLVWRSCFQSRVGAMWLCKIYLEESPLGYTTRFISYQSGGTCRVASWLVLLVSACVWLMSSPVERGHTLDAIKRQRQICRCGYFGSLTTMECKKEISIHIIVC